MISLVGIEEVRKIDQIVSDDKVDKVFSKMGFSLTTVIAKVMLSEEEEADLVEPSNLSEPIYHKDIKVYMKELLGYIITKFATEPDQNNN